MRSVSQSLLGAPSNREYLGEESSRFSSRHPLHDAGGPVQHALHIPKLGPAGMMRNSLASVAAAAAPLPCRSRHALPWSVRPKLARFGPILVRFGLSSAMCYPKIVKVCRTRARSRPIQTAEIDHVRSKLGKVGPKLATIGQWPIRAKGGQSWSSQHRGTSGQSETKFGRSRPPW